MMTSTKKAIFDFWETHVGKFRGVPVKILDELDLLIRADERAIVFTPKANETPICLHHWHSTQNTFPPYNQINQVCCHCGMKTTYAITAVGGTSVTAHKCGGWAPQTFTVWQ